MNRENFNKAIEIISRYHSSLIFVNTPVNGFVGNLGETKLSIHIRKCVPSCINALIIEGYSLGMTDDGLYVDKF